MAEDENGDVEEKELKEQEEKEKEAVKKEKENQNENENEKEVGRVDGGKKIGTLKWSENGRRLPKGTKESRRKTSEGVGIDGTGGLGSEAVVKAGATRRQLRGREQSEMERRACVGEGKRKTGGAVGRQVGRGDGSMEQKGDGGGGTGSGGW